MKTKLDLKKSLIWIFTIGVVLIGAWWICSGCAAEQTESGVSEPPYIYDRERTFTVGFIEPIQEGSWETPIPKMEGEDIYSFTIRDILGTYPKMQPGKGDIEPSDFEGEPFFFTGYVKSYDINRLIKENPDIEWLWYRSSFISCFEIEYMIPVEDNDSVLSLEAPEKLSDEFEVSVTVKNILPIELVDTTLNIAIMYGPFRIVAIEPSDLDTTSSSYYPRIIKGEYEAGEEKNYIVKIQSRNSGEINSTDFEISASFGGYAIEGDNDKVLLEEKDIQPLYSKEVRKYKL